MVVQRRGRCFAYQFRILGGAVTQPLTSSSWWGPQGRMLRATDSAVGSEAPPSSAVPAELCKDGCSHQRRTCPSRAKARSSHSSAMSEALSSANTTCNPRVSRPARRQALGLAAARHARLPASSRQRGHAGETWLGAGPPLTSVCGPDWNMRAHAAPHLCPRAAASEKGYRTLHCCSF